MWSQMCDFNISVMLRHLQIKPPMVLEQIQYLDAFEHSCFNVSMSVNCTACPPPLVLKMLP